MENKFSVRRVEEGLDNDGLQMRETGGVILSVNNDNVNGLVNTNTASTTCLYETSGTKRRRSLAQLTREALPRLENYRNSRRALKRPSIGELLHGSEKVLEEPAANGEVIEVKVPTEPTGGHGIKLGWIQGVLIPCLLNIWGVMLFLRLSWVVAQSGVAFSLIIIGISAVVCIITTLSLSAICTNGEVKGGGIYYIISRSLGPEFGASVGIVFAFANAVSASMNTIGFCSSLNDLLSSYDLKIVDGGNNDIRIVGTIAILIMVMICAVGMEWESKAQNFLIAIITGAIFDFIIGTVVGPVSDEQKAMGFSGISYDIFKSNWMPDYRHQDGVAYDFFQVFAIFFPSVTGIQAGANISGDLKDPASSIPKGTMLSLLISMISYAVFVLLAGAAAMRDASGSVADLTNGTLTGCADSSSCQYGLFNSYSATADFGTLPKSTYKFKEEPKDETLSFWVSGSEIGKEEVRLGYLGLASLTFTLPFHYIIYVFPWVMQLMSMWGPLIYGGCFAATLSTALTNLLSVPRLIQALGIDRIYPGLIFFSKGYGKAGEPYRGYVLTFFVAAAFVLIAEINLIAPLISNFYLASYAMINFCTFHAALIKPLGWRPQFRYYNTWLSLAGFIMCVVIMFLINWKSSLITFIVILGLYLIVVYRKPDVNWGSSTQAQTYKTALTSTHRLTNIGDHVKNYQPQVLLLCGKPQARPALLDFANLITKNNSLLVIGDISEQRLSYRTRSSRTKTTYQWLRDQKIKSFYTIVDGMKQLTGAKALIQAAGIGKLIPNVLMIGYKKNWRICNQDEVVDYFDILHTAFDNRLAVVIFCLPDGLDCSKILEEEDQCGSSTNDPPSRSDLHTSPSTHIMHTDSNLDIAHLGIQEPIITLSFPSINMVTNSNNSTISKNVRNKKRGIVNNILYTPPNMRRHLPTSTSSDTAVFKKKQEKGTIDVWWLYDDGGLTMLIPYIISLRHDWNQCKMRVFALANHKHEIETEQKNMENLLAKFRLNYSSLEMVQISDRPKEATQQFFNTLIEDYRAGDNSERNDSCISDFELATLQDKTHRQLRLRELLLEKSSQASLVVMSLPMPRKGSVSPSLYMAWLEVLTKDMPPYLLIRGNQQSVLTFYS